MNWGKGGDFERTGIHGDSWTPVDPALAPRPEPRSRPWLHVLLFLATAVTTTAVGGFAFSVTLLAILGIHEFGHYFASRRWGVKATLPYFIPLPPASVYFPVLSFGTMGAIIKIRSPIPSRNALIDIGAAGPIAGFLVAFLALCVGLGLSDIRSTAEAGGGLFLGDSILSSFLAHAIVGKPSPGTDIFLHPVALAGWLGLFITVLNLLPIGQLDGGHIVYALFGGRRHTVIANVSTAAVFLMMAFGPPYEWIGALGAFGVTGALKVWMANRWYGWLFFVLLIRFVLGVRHPPPVDPQTPVDPGRKVVGYVALAIFAFCFIPIPFSGF
jgi:membrane-associated protease RseP (regulator of RpoE activity)